ncbi:MAG TPA: mannitol dehydrogenase family protein [Candidatus Competibacteraceae bacterium]|nr:mannitol dehydrogenase family protein [Candidatus Competibacteraceae bacterium]
MAIKLNEANLKLLAPKMRVPSYDRNRVQQSIVHIGVGGFFRAHQAVYLDDLLHQSGHAEWGYCGVGLLRQDDRMRDALLPQDCLYSVVERSAAGDSARVIGALLRFYYAPDDPQAVIEKMASAECRIVSLTITEGGYYLNEGSGEFDDTHPDIVHDLQYPHAPRCSFGYLLEALDRRRSRGLPPFTVMSCDNLQHNGDVAKKMLLAFAERRDPALHRWLAEHCAFPNSMVDRITPATTDEHRALVRERFGLDDAWPVTTEPFMQWVIEDNFPNGRPAWERVGAQMTADVLPYEKMKMRLLNASHQAMCYIGMLLGYQYAHETMADAQIRKLVQTMMDVEVTPLLAPVPGVDLAEYKKTLIERFANPAICDQLSRIGTEGSARIPKFVLPSIREQLARGGPIKLLSFTVASWFRYLTGSDDQGRALPIIDPLADRLREHARRGGRDPGALLGLSELFGADLPQAQPFVEQVREALGSLYEHGARATLARYVES